MMAVVEMFEIIVKQSFWESEIIKMRDIGR